MSQRIILEKRLKEFERRHENLEGNFITEIENLKRRIWEIDNQKRKNKSKNIENIIIALFILILFIIASVLLYKEINTPTYNYDEAIVYFENGAKCLGFRTGIWDKNIKDARKVKMLYNGKKSWFYTDFTTARRIWENYKEEKL